MGAWESSRLEDAADTDPALTPPGRRGRRMELAVAALMIMVGAWIYHLGPGRRPPAIKPGHAATAGIGADAATMPAGLLPQSAEIQLRLLDQLGGPVTLQAVDAAGHLAIMRGRRLELYQLDADRLDAPRLLGRSDIIETPILDLALAGERALLLEDEHPAVQGLIEIDLGSGFRAGEIAAGEEAYLPQLRRRKVLMAEGPGSGDPYLRPFAMDLLPTEDGSLPHDAWVLVRSLDQSDPQVKLGRLLLDVAEAAWVDDVELVDLPEGVQDLALDGKGERLYIAVADASQVVEGAAKTLFRSDPRGGVLIMDVADPTALPRLLGRIRGIPPSPGPLVRDPGTGLLYARVWTDLFRITGTETIDSTRLDRTEQAVFVFEPWGGVTVDLAGRGIFSGGLRTLSVWSLGNRQTVASSSDNYGVWDLARVFANPHDGRVTEWRGRTATEAANELANLTVDQIEERHRNMLLANPSQYFYRLPIGDIERRARRLLNGHLDFVRPYPLIKDTLAASPSFSLRLTDELATGLGLPEPLEPTSLLEIVGPAATATAGAVVDPPRGTDLLGSRPANSADSSFPDPAIFDVVEQDGFVLLLEPDKGIAVIDRSNPAAMRVTRRLPMPGASRMVGFAGGLAVLAADPSSSGQSIPDASDEHVVVVLDLLDDSGEPGREPSLKEIDRWSTQAGASGLLAADGRMGRGWRDYTLYVAQETAGSPTGSITARHRLWATPQNLTWADRLLRNADRPTMIGTRVSTASYHLGLGGQFELAGRRGQPSDILALFASRGLLYVLDARQGLVVLDTVTDPYWARVAVPVVGAEVGAAQPTGVGTATAAPAVPDLRAASGPRISVSLGDGRDPVLTQGYVWLTGHPQYLAPLGRQLWTEPARLRAGDGEGMDFSGELALRDLPPTVRRAGGGNGVPVRVELKFGVR